MWVILDLLYYVEVVKHRVRREVCIELKVVSFSMRKPIVVCLYAGRRYIGLLEVHPVKPAIPISLCVSMGFPLFVVSRTILY